MASESDQSMKVTGLVPTPPDGLWLTCGVHSFRIDWWRHLSGGPTLTFRPLQAPLESRFAPTHGHCESANRIIGRNGTVFGVAPLRNEEHWLVVAPPNPAPLRSEILQPYF
jgi:hypothetical protein